MDLRSSSFRAFEFFMGLFAFKVAADLGSNDLRVLMIVSKHSDLDWLGNITLDSFDPILHSGVNTDWRDTLTLRENLRLGDYVNKGRILQWLFDPPKEVGFAATNAFGDIMWYASFNISGVGPNIKGWFTSERLMNVVPSEWRDRRTNQSAANTTFLSLASEFNPVLSIHPRGNASLGWFAWIGDYDGKLRDMQFVFARTTAPQPWAVLTSPTECIQSLSGYEYNGTVSYTAMGLTCARGTPFCRNEQGRDHPACYGENGLLEPCSIPKCDTKPRECAFQNEYFGRDNATVDGVMCIPWTDITDAGTTSVKHEGNYCRYIGGRENAECPVRSFVGGLGQVSLDPCNIPLCDPLIPIKCVQRYKVDQFSKLSTNTKEECFSLCQVETGTASPIIAVMKDENTLWENCVCIESHTSIPACWNCPSIEDCGQTDFFLYRKCSVSWPNYSSSGHVLLYSDIVRMASNLTLMIDMPSIGFEVAYINGLYVEMICTSVLSSSTQTTFTLSYSHEPCHVGKSMNYSDPQSSTPIKKFVTERFQTLEILRVLCVSFMFHELMIAADNTICRDVQVKLYTTDTDDPTVEPPTTSRDSTTGMDSTRSHTNTDQPSFGMLSSTTLQTDTAIATTEEPIRTTIATPEASTSTFSEGLTTENVTQAASLEERFSTSLMEASPLPSDKTESTHYGGLQPTTKVSVVTGNTDGRSTAPRDPFTNESTLKETSIKVPKSTTQNAQSASIMTSDTHVSYSVPQMTHLYTTDLQTTSNRTTSVTESAQISTTTPPSCLCNCTLSPTKWYNLTLLNLTYEELEDELRHKITRIKKTLQVDKTKLTHRMIKKMSLQDNRPSCISIGCLGIAIIIFASGFLIFLDCTSLNESYNVERMNKT